ncbi:hypothetical protein HK096_000125, partial [Nowakowskiella sp. JEL0078]
MGAELKELKKKKRKKDEIEETSKSRKNLGKFEMETSSVINQTPTDTKEFQNFQNALQLTPTIKKTPKKRRTFDRPPESDSSDLFVEDNRTPNSHEEPKTPSILTTNDNENIIPPIVSTTLTYKVTEALNLLKMQVEKESFDNTQTPPQSLYSYLTSVAKLATEDSISLEQIAEHVSKILPCKSSLLS